MSPNLGLIRIPGDLDCQNPRSILQKAQAGSGFSESLYLRLLGSRPFVQDLRIDTDSQQVLSALYWTPSQYLTCYCIQFVPPFKVGFGSFFYSFNRPKNETERELESRHSGSRLVFNHYAFLNKQDPFLVYLNSACTWADQKKDQKKSRNSKDNMTHSLEDPKVPTWKQ